MTARVRVRALSATVLGLLIVALVAGPALAWHVDITAKAECADEGVLVTWSVSAADEEWTASDVDVWYTVDAGTEKFPLVQNGKFDQTTRSFEGNFTLEGGESVTIHSSVAWDNKETTYKKTTVELPDCKGETTTTSSATTTTAAPTTTTQAPTTTAPTTTQAPTTTVAGTGTTVEETTTTAVVILPTTTQVGGLPFTGANTLPLLFGGALLLVAGFAVLKATKARAGGNTEQ